jgi:hypothetical protein
MNPRKGWNCTTPPDTTLRQPPQTPVPCQPLTQSTTSSEGGSATLFLCWHSSSSSSFQADARGWPKANKGVDPQPCSLVNHCPISVLGHGLAGSMARWRGEAVLCCLLRLDHPSQPALERCVTYKMIATTPPHAPSLIFLTPLVCQLLSVQSFRRLLRVGIVGPSQFMFLS